MPTETASAPRPLPAASSRQVLVDWNPSPSAFPEETVPQLFARQATATPDAIAVQYGSRTLRYGELEAQANRLAHWLVRQGVGPGKGVVVLLDRSPELVVALLGIQIAGGYYVPVEPEYPADRIDLILADCAPAALVTGAEPLRKVSRPPRATIRLDADLATLAALPASAPDVAQSLDNPIYAIYTSGSTGKPKGALLYQRGEVNLLHWYLRAFGMGPQTAFLMVASIGFDLQQKSVFAPLLAGGRLAILDSPAFDPALIRARVAEFGITTINCAPSAFYAVIEDADETVWRQLAPLTHVILGGELIHKPRLRPWLRNRWCKAEVVNSYGPTECTDVQVYHRIAREEFDHDAPIPIGKPVENCFVYVLDDGLQPVDIGEKGQLWIGGVCVGAGYINLPERTAQSFRDNPFRPGEPFYASGDVASWRPDGTLDCHGRIDHQVKVRGYRIELGEIEAELARAPGILESAVTAPEAVPGERFLAAYVRLAPGAAPDEVALTRHLSIHLPSHMLPSSWTFLDRFPVTASGKLDRLALRLPARFETATPAAGVSIEDRIAAQWSQALGGREIPRDARFFEVGGNSLQAIQFVGRLAKQLGVRLPMVEFFRTPTVDGFGQYLRRAHAAAVTAWTGEAGVAPPPVARPLPVRTSASPASSAKVDGAIAVVGLSIRVPDAPDPETFWKNLLDGRESLRLLSPEELRAANVPESVLNNPDWVPVTGWMDDADCFDHRFFGYAPREADVIDPQQRVLLETAWGALEHAGIALDRSDRRIGVFTGVAPNTYFTTGLVTHPEFREFGLTHTVLASDKDYSATRVAFKLDLRGPAIGVQTACSSSGIAIHLACQSLKAGDCDAAIAGGACIPWHYRCGHEYVDDGPLTKDGHIRVFDAEGSGMALAAGAACVVLKRLDDAIAAGDTVYAVIRSTAINNDGSDKVAFTAPSVDGQVGVVREALARAGVAAQTISYVEAHGTGTRLGDPIEVAALTQAFREHTDQVGFCRIGSVKTNIGHLDAAAAAVGLVKTALALTHRQLPASLNYHIPNPECAFETSPFVVNTATRDWTCAGPLRAGLSSFGFGGTNFHAVLEEGPLRENSPALRRLQVLRLSARTDEALAQQASNLADWLGQHPKACLADVAFTLDRGRVRFDKRAVVVGRDVAEARAKLAYPIAGTPASPRPSLVFMFPGQGSQHVGMAQELYQTEIVFRSEIDRCAALLRPLLEVDLRTIIYPEAIDTAFATETLKATQLAQPAIFTIAYATAKLWMSWGFEPADMIGHSVGEFVAATIAGVFTLEDALAILAQRAKLMQSMPAGGMLAARLGEEGALPYCGAGIGIAGVNAPQLTVFSGPHPALEALKEKLEAAGIGASALHTSHAFHSSMMEPVIEPFAQIVASRPRKPPTRRFHSSLTGKPITPEQAQDPQYWGQQLRNAVRFAPGVADLAQEKGRVFLECGPGQNLTTSVRQILKPAQQAVAIASLPHSGAQNADDAEHLLQALGRLWLAGVEPDAARLYAGEVRLKLGLPTYAFARDRHYIAPLEKQPVAASSATRNLDAEAQSPLAPEASGNVAETPEAKAMAAARKIFGDVTGIEIGPEGSDKTFLELGFDSLLLTQVTSKLKLAFKVNLRFRQLLEEYTTLRALSVYLGPSAGQASASGAPAASSEPDGAIGPVPATPGDGKPAKAFGAGVRIQKAKEDGLAPRQRQSIDALVQRTIARTGKSKASAQQHRPYLADPRTVSGFRPLWKEMVYPIVSTRSDGAFLWDVDGNEYIDVINGFGATFFGHKPDFVNKAIVEQLDKGYEIGPIQDFIGEAAERFTRMVKLERVAFCNTGSEAVSAAVRCARTVTGKDLVASFTGDYHGIHDEVIVRPGPSGRGLPAAGGIPPSHVSNTLILDYGEQKSLEILRARADEFAAIMVEPVQSRRPDLQPRAFLQACREIAEASGCAFIMDEVICGFRAAPGGAQEYFGVKADLATYGKVFGGGMPIGAIAGTAKFMDALDGGAWNFGDDTVPEAGVTYFAGTFVRHPVNMAAVLATLKHLEAHPTVQADMNARVGAFVERIRALLDQLRAPLRVAHFSSIYRFEFTQDEAFGELLYYYFRERGLHAYDGRLAVMTTRHDDAVLERILGIYRDAITTMQRDGLLGRVGEPVVMGQHKASGPIWYLPPVPDARVGRDIDGNPAWFVPDPARPGKFMKVRALNG